MPKFLPRPFAACGAKPFMFVSVLQPPWVTPPWSTAQTEKEPFQLWTLATRTRCPSPPPKSPSVLMTTSTPLCFLCSSTRFPSRCAWPSPPRARPTLHQVIWTSPSCLTSCTVTWGICTIRTSAASPPLSTEPMSSSSIFWSSPSMCLFILISCAMKRWLCQRMLMMVPQIMRRPATMPSCLFFTEIKCGSVCIVAPSMAAPGSTALFLGSYFIRIKWSFSSPGLWLDASKMCSCGFWLGVSVNLCKGRLCWWWVWW